MKLSNHRIGLLRRLDPAELIIELAEMGSPMVNRIEGETYEQWLEREKEIVLAGAHKARLLAGSTFTLDERFTSRRWLKRHGYSEWLKH